VTACIFIGPTISVREAREFLGAAFLPPARQGDIMRVVSTLKPQAIGLIDGYFQSVPSVWHKEILWAIHRGVHVFGAASMGALRAAELTTFGMRGIGRIYEGYRDGLLSGCGGAPFEDDDEVAVVHGPADAGYIALADAMVNIRCTLANACAAGIVDEKERDHLVSIAKSIFFPERSYTLMIARAVEAGVDATQLAKLEAWLPAGRVNQKKIDAIALLKTMNSFLASDPAPARAAFAFQHTTLWETALAAAKPASLACPEELLVLNELRIAGTQYDTLYADVLEGLLPGADDVSSDEASVALDISSRHQEPAQIEKILAEVSRQVELATSRERLPRALIEAQILVRISNSDDFKRLLDRAREKEAMLSKAGQAPDIDEFSDLQLLQLRDWYFSTILDCEMPDDLEQRVQAWGYVDIDSFHHEVLREFAYRKARSSSPGSEVRE
jgi:hypothetical protein